MMTSILQSSALLSAVFYKGYKPGQIYIHRDHIYDPFTDPSSYKVEIIDYSSGYVAYKFLLGNDMIKHSLRRDTFGFVYKLSKK